MRTIFKKSLEEKYLFGFDITSSSENRESEYIIVPSHSHKRQFSITLRIKGDTRITFMCEPEKYAADMVSIISSSSKEKRNVFYEYWDELEKEGCRVNVYVNDSLIGKEDFCGYNKEIKQFYFRVTKAPYFDEKDYKKDKLIHFVSIVVGMILSLIPYEIEGKKEGSVNYIKSKKFERNPVNRELCLQAKGYKCSVCGMDFGREYGPIGKGFIHVHHSIPVSQMGENYIVNPIKELFPVCPNCHAMLHKKEPPYTIDELRSIIEKYSERDK